ncbi:MAG: CBS domain-containing protein [Acidobacteriota bacterium]|jgi:CBS domain-containing protein
MNERFVHDVLDDKGRDVYTVPPGATVYEALELMAERNIGALVVLDNDRIVGIFSERDYARKLELAGKRGHDTPVREIMTDVVATVSSSHSMKDCMGLMTNERVRHLPVVEGGQLVGLVSIGDVVKSIMTTQEEMIRQLEAYITGRV